ncbi:hypothetical protein [Deinococcus peraridilitoris]|uniref:hypothetical protein n=1 Tax=Deinococcus peraridilitoris TaxID=432329 RepID=UPI00059D8308|nr:hypothetical protein [Deinococcus peraridilitoris]
MFTQRLQAPLQLPFRVGERELLADLRNQIVQVDAFPMKFHPGKSREVKQLIDQHLHLRCRLINHLE